MPQALPTALQFLAILLLALVAGSVFGIWQGYNPAAYSANTFLEVHQGAVRGLNALLPATAFATLACVAVLAVLARARPTVLALYVIVIVGIAFGGITTRIFNQTINAEVMTWTAQSIPANWMELRAEWWHWHLVRAAASIVSLMVLIAAVFADRNKYFARSR